MGKYYTEEMASTPINLKLVLFLGLSVAPSHFIMRDDRACIGCTICYFFKSFIILLFLFFELFQDFRKKKGKKPLISFSYLSS
ncbi:hypothetical protein VNO78_17600 [Psophocarpus tetragonolobus]|uniref:Uncharacterized protein n=1 Tax=Psophocarpus tetragonolobus TaxID=3891 RepID=A0AAN9SJ77_PSOTE